MNCKASSEAAEHARVYELCWNFKYQIWSRSSGPLMDLRRLGQT